MVATRVRKARVDELAVDPALGGGGAEHPLRELGGDRARPRDSTSTVAGGTEPGSVLAYARGDQGTVQDWPWESHGLVAVGLGFAVFVASAVVGGLGALATVDPALGFVVVLAVVAGVSALVGWAMRL